MNKYNEEGIMFYAFRYALGRKTYAVSTVSTALIDNWHLISNKTKEIIIDEINKAIEKGDAGMEMDVKQWKAVLLLEEATKDSNSGGKDE